MLTTSRTISSARRRIVHSRSRGESCCIGELRAPWIPSSDATAPSQRTLLIMPRLQRMTIWQRTRADLQVNAALLQFANTEAASFAERGLRHAERLAEGPARLELRIAMLKTRVLAANRSWLSAAPAAGGHDCRATNDAEALGLQAAAATGHYLLSVLHQEAGDAQQAETSTLRAAEAGRTADDTTRARQLANTARCLLETGD